MANDKKLSENISDFLNLMSDADASYEYMKEKLNETDKATQDILHTLELENPDYKERAKNWLRNCRKYAVPAGHIRTV